MEISTKKEPGDRLFFAPSGAPDVVIREGWKRKTAKS